MNLNNASIIISAVSPAQYPKNDLPEIALAGRSNVGKSSLINKLLNRRNLARTSSSPGKTATINFYDIDNTFNIVDLPGYGFAKVSKSEKDKWGKMIEEYLSTRDQLVQVIQLVDIRHKPSKEDITMFNWITQSGFAPIVVATKKDKLRSSQRQAAIDLIEDTLQTDIVIPFSAEKGDGRDEVWELINKVLEVPAE